MQRGFTLIEVVVALGILALSLSILLEVQLSSVNHVGQARNLSVASLLARSKMVDIEESLMSDGFNIGDIEENGDFKEEGYPDIAWMYEVKEVELDLSRLLDMCGDAASEDAGDDIEGNACEGAGNLIPGMDGLMSEIGRSIRAVKLKVSWKEGAFDEAIEVKTLVSKDDFSIVPQGQGNSGVSAGSASGSTP